MVTTQQTGEAAASARGLSVPLALGLGPFLIAFDQTLASALFPAILGDLGGEVADASWMITGGNLALAGGVVVGGRLADARGRRNVFVASLLAWAVLTTLCALAPGFASLTVLRVLLGLAGALLLASSLGLIASAVPPDRQAAAAGLYAASSGLGPMLGPLAAAGLAGSLGWRFGFVASAPLALAGALLALRVVPVDRARRGVRVDWTSGALAGLAVAAVLIALSSAPRSGASPLVLGALVAAAVAGILLIRAESQSTDPMIPEGLRNAGYAATFVCTLGIGFVLGVGLFSIPLFVTQALGRGFEQGAIALLPASVLMVVASIAAGPVVERVGFRMPCGIGLAWTVAALLVAPLVLRDGAPLAAVLLFSGFAGVGFGIGTPAAAVGALRTAPDADSGAASGWHHCGRLLGTAAGVMAFAVLASTPELGDPANARAHATRSLAAAERAAALGGLERVLACSTPTCVENELSALPESVVSVLRAARERALGSRYRLAYLVCGAFAAFLLAAWLRLAARQPRRAAGASRAGGIP